LSIRSARAATIESCILNGLEAPRQALLTHRRAGMSESRHEATKRDIRPHSCRLPARGERRLQPNCRVFQTPNRLESRLPLSHRGSRDNVEVSRMTGMPRKLRVTDLAAMKQRGERIVMLTAYDATMSRLFDQAGIDLLLVGDSLGQVILGLDTTIPVTLDAVLHHTKAVTRGVSRALVVADLPFMTYQISADQAMQNAARLFQEGGAAAVKLEGGRAVADTVRRLTAAGLPVMGHVGLTPQHVHRLGGMRQQARGEEAARELMLDALALEEAGAFAVVLEAVPDAVAAAVTSRLHIPTIGIGAGPRCDGQVLVSYDMLGLFDAFVPPFVKQYARLADDILSAAKDYAAEVRQGIYPQAHESRREGPSVVA